jgi:hypothetical protein
VEQVLPGLEGWGEVAQRMHTHVSKCKNDEIKGEKKTLSQIISCPFVLVTFSL